MGNACSCTDSPTVEISLTTNSPTSGHDAFQSSPTLGSSECDNGTMASERCRSSVTPTTVLTTNGGGSGGAVNVLFAAHHRQSQSTPDPITVLTGTVLSTLGSACTILPVEQQTEIDNNNSDPSLVLAPQLACLVPVHSDPTATATHGSRGTQDPALLCSVNAQYDTRSAASRSGTSPLRDSPFHFARIETTQSQQQQVVDVDEFQHASHPSHLHHRGGGASPNAANDRQFNFIDTPSVTEQQLQQQEESPENSPRLLETSSHSVVDPRGAAGGGAGTSFLALQDSHRATDSKSDPSLYGSKSVAAKAATSDDTLSITDDLAFEVQRKDVMTCVTSPPA